MQKKYLILKKSFKRLLIVEDIVAPNIPRIASHYFGCDEVDYIAIRVKKRSTTDRSRRKEFDAIAVCEGFFILNETKSHPEIRDVDKMAAFVKSGELTEKRHPFGMGYRVTKSEMICKDLNQYGHMI